MISHANALLAPAEIDALTSKDLDQVVCVVFDILRATTSLITALANGAESVFPVSEISEVLRLKDTQPNILLGGERHGLRITAAASGGVDFDLGNSPFEYSREKVAGRTLACTTTNGTRALRGCQRASAVFAGSFLNLDATARAVRATGLSRLLLVGAGTEDEAAYEDILAVGALADALAPDLHAATCSDSIHLARNAFLAARPDLLGHVGQFARNGRRLMTLPDLAPDVAFSLRLNTLDFAARLDSDGAVRKCG